MQGPTKIAVAGATGRVGRHVVDVLEARGHDVVPMSRADWCGRGDRRGPGGGAAGRGGHRRRGHRAVARREGGHGVLHVVDRATCRRRASAPGCSGSSSCRSSASTGSSGATARRSSPTRRRCWPGPIPVRILRAAQFHEFVGQLVEWGRQGDVELRAPDAHAARRRSGRRGGAGRPGHRPDAAPAPGPGGVDPRDRRPARGAPGRGGAGCSSPDAANSLPDRGGERPGRPGPRAVRVGRAAARPGRHPGRARRSRSGSTSPRVSPRRPAGRR